MVMIEEIKERRLRGNEREEDDRGEERGIRRNGGDR